MFLLFSSESVRQEKTSMQSSACGRAAQNVDGKPQLCGFMY